MTQVHSALAVDGGRVFMSNYFCEGVLAFSTSTGAYLWGGANKASSCASADSAPAGR